MTGGYSRCSITWCCTGSLTHCGELFPLTFSTNSRLFCHHNHKMHTTHTEKSFLPFCCIFFNYLHFVDLTKALLSKDAPYFVSHYNTFTPNLLKSSMCFDLIHTWTEPQEPTHRSDTLSSTCTVGTGQHHTTAHNHTYWIPILWSN